MKLQEIEVLTPEMVAEALKPYYPPKRFPGAAAIAKEMQQGKLKAIKLAGMWLTTADSVKEWLNGSESS